MIKPYFLSCIFKSNLTNIDFNGSSFEDCVFQNKLKEIWFRGEFPLKKMEREFGTTKGNFVGTNCFKNAKVNDLVFSNNCNLDKIQKPNDPHVFLVLNWGNALEKFNMLRHELDSDDKNEAEILYKSFMIHAKYQNHYLINVEDLKGAYPEKVVDLLLKVITAQE